MVSQNSEDTGRAEAPASLRATAATWPDTYRQKRGRLTEREALGQDQFRCERDIHTKKKTKKSVYYFWKHQKGIVGYDKLFSLHFVPWHRPRLSRCRPGGGRQRSRRVRV